VDIDCSPVDDLREQLARCTLSVFPFKYDGTTIAPPYTVVEAMSVGLPVIGTRVACLSPILVDSRNGSVVPVDDPGALAAAIQNVLSDGATWDALSVGALETVYRSWSWGRAARVTAELYEEVLASTG
jgi:starch synthase